MNEWEYFYDKKNNLDFVFVTDEKKRIGVYPEFDAPSKPKRLNVKADWITLY